MHIIQSLTSLVLICGIYEAVSSSPQTLNDYLLTKAIPVKEHNRELGYFWNKNKSGTTSETTYQYDDDFYTLENQFQFKGYSLHYERCAKVQRFSPDAVLEGDYSSMITDNIVTLRLCPKSICYSASRNGCISGYGEYAIDLNDYITAIAKYEIEKEERFCEFCAVCNYDSNTAASSSSAHSYYNNGQRDLGSSYFKSKDGTTRMYSSGTCYTYMSQCQSQCSSYYSGTSAYTNYLNYIGCQKVQSQDGKYFWVSPTCDTTYNKVTLGVYYDNQCQVDASASISVDYILSNSFDSDTLASITKVTCTECEESVYPPFYNSNNLLCNNVYQHSAQCDNMINIGSQYYTDDGTITTSSSQAALQCAFIKSVTSGAFGTDGEIVTSSFSSIEGSVSAGQVVTLVILSLLSAGLAMFSFITHHKMTSFLLKSLGSGLAGSKKRWVRRAKSTMSDESTVGSTDTRSFDNETIGSIANTRTSTSNSINLDRL